MPAPDAPADAESPPAPTAAGRRWRVQSYLHVLVTLTLLPLLCFIVYDAYDVGRGELERAQRDAARLAARVAEDTTRFLDDAETLLALLAQRTTALDIAARRCDPMLGEMPALFPAMADIGLRDQAGELLCQLPPMARAVAVGPWFAQAMDSTRMTVSGALQPESGAHWIVLASHPVRDGEGRIVGWLSARLDLQRLQARVAHTLPPQAVVSVLDPGARILMRTLDPQKWIGSPSRDRERIERMRAKGEGFERDRGIDGETRIYAYRTIPSTRWLVVAGLPESAVLTPFWQRVLRSVVPPVAALLLALLLARIVSLRISSTLLALARTALRVSRGESGLRASPGDGPLEVALLAREFNQALDAKDLAQASAREADRRFRETLDNVALLAVAFDERGIIHYVNEHLCLATGWPAEELIGRNWFETFVPPERAHRKVLFDQAMQGGAPLETHTETTLLTRSAQRRLVRWNSTVLRFADGRPAGVSRIGEDITEQVAAERRLRRLRDFYEALSRTNAAIVRMGEPEDLFKEICSICVQYGRAKIAFIALASGALARPVAFAGPAEQFVEGLAGTLALEPGQGVAQGPIATAILSGKPYISNDFLQDPKTEPWRERASQLGTRATAAFPLRRGGQVIGALSLHVPEVDFFDEELIALLSEMMTNLSFALDNHDREAEGQAAERRLQLAAQAGRIGFWDWDLREEHIFYSDEWARQIGFAPSELTTTLAEWQSRVHPDDFAAAAGAIQEFIERPTPSFEVEMRLRHRDGGWRWMLTHASLMLDERGRAQRMLGSQIDITERKTAEQRIQYLATHDGLTGLPNRTMVRDRIAQAVSHTRRTGQMLAVACVDLDRFKHINDGFGHAFGDALLEAVGQRLVALVREGDTVARPGGDEFLLVLSNLGKLADVYRVAQKILDTFEAPLSVQGREVFATASIGLSVHPQNGIDADELIGNADLAMYRAKKLGGGTYQFFTAEMGEGIAQRVEFENRLRQALPLGQLHLAYQPKVDLGSGAIVGAEALLRWNHPELGSVSPARFIPIAEETGLIVPIGDWVLRTACRQNQLWRAEGLPPITVAVNVSVRQFQQADLLARVRSALADSGLPAQGLELELTESVIAQDADNVVRTVGELRELGVRLSVDDFGTGYSSLSYLKRFDVNALKIDQSFVRDLLVDPDDAAITLAVISLARSLRMSSIAEGVETAEQCDFLRAHGCDQIQGYYCSRPVPAEALAQMLREGKCLASSS